jgi:hypothetical protein
VESFQLDAAIAASCSASGAQAINYSLKTCTAAEEEPGLGYFGAACATEGGINVETLVGGDGNDGFCYHGPYADLATLFMNS